MYTRMNITNRSTVFNNKTKKIIIAPNPTISAPFNLEYRVPSIQNTIASSQRGQYVSFCASGGIYSSSDYAVSFVYFPFNSVFSSIAMSTSGQYQVCSSYGVPNVVVYFSNNYGASWLLKWNTGSHDARYIEQSVISPDGKYIYCCGGGVAGSSSILSIDFGNTFQAQGGILQRPFCCLFNDKAIFYNVYDQSFYSAILSATPIAETYYLSGAFQGNTQKIYCNSFGSIICVVHRDQNLMAVSTDSGVTFQNLATPNNMHKLHITSGVFYCSTNTSIYKSNDFGVSWILLYNVPAGKTIRSMCGNITYIYMVYLTGEVSVLTITSGKLVI